MKRALLVIASSLFVSSIALADTTPTVPTAPIAPISTLKLPLLPCVDPAVTAVDYALVAKKSATTGTVRIRGTVKNIGNAPYTSRADQQVAQLYEVPLGGGAPKLLATRAFQNLAAGESFSFSVDKEWSSTTEFPPSYKVVIVYDPDIRNDGNLKNDDCRMGNNVVQRSGYDLNALFH
jgi:hypothetical protein